MYEDLILSAIPAAKKVARTFRGAIDSDEAIGIAMLTLVQIAPRFEPERGVKFTTFAIRRIIGALQDVQRVDRHGVTNAPRGTYVEHLQIVPGVAITRRTVADYRLLRFALAKLPDKERKVIKTWMDHSEGPARAKANAQLAHEVIGMNVCTFHFYRRRAMTALHATLYRRGVRKLSDVL
jgi:RNA polymerase sigma factor (sigma-70 family)